MTHSYPVQFLKSVGSRFSAAETTESLKEISEIAKTMANIEGLEGHRNSIQRRIKNEH